MKPSLIFLAILVAASTVAAADVINQSRFPVYVDDESLGMIWLLPPGAVFHGRQDAIAAPFVKRKAIYKTVNGEDLEITPNNRLRAFSSRIESRAGQLILGGWFDESWIRTPKGYRFQRLYNYSR